MHRLGLAALCLGSIAIHLSLGWALGSTQILSGEETSVSIRDPLFLELRRQYEPICTNIAAHTFYWLGQQLIPAPGLFFGRFQKAVVMGLVPLFGASYLERRGSSRRVALLTAALLALMPGFFLFAPLATEYGLECVTGMAALWLASSQQPAARWLAAPLASWTALTYGSGLAFVPAIAWQALERERAPGLRRTSLWLAGFAAPWVVPFVIWQNQPHLLTGGGTLSSLSTLLHHLGQLVREASWRGGSYYYFASFPALSQPMIALAALAAVAWLAAERKHGAVIVGWLAAVAIYLASGREIGMRRGVPIVVFSMLALGLAWPALQRLRVPRALGPALLGLCFAVSLVQLSITVARFASGTWRVPLDFDFEVLPGRTMAETYRHLLAHPEAIDSRYEPERTWAVLHLLSRDAQLPAAERFTTAAIAKRLQP